MIVAYYAQRYANKNLNTAVSPTVMNAEQSPSYPILPEVSKFLHRFTNLAKPIPRQHFVREDCLGLSVKVVYFCHFCGVQGIESMGDRVFSTALPTAQYSA